MIRNKPHNNQLCTDLFRFISAYPVVSHFLRFAWQTTLGDDEIAVSGHTAIIHHTLSPKYLCYYFHTAMFYAQKKKLAHGTKVIEVTPDKLADITIPVPPIEVQTEIVKILDNFTELSAELSAELTAELTARKKQYEYYRDLLLDFGVHGGGDK